MFVIIRGISPPFLKGDEPRSMQRSRRKLSEGREARLIRLEKGNCPRSAFVLIWINMGVIFRNGLR
jgi:hypothetical protein